MAHLYVPYTIYWYLPSLILILPVHGGWTAKWMDTPGSGLFIFMAADSRRTSRVWILHEVPTTVFKGALMVPCSLSWLPAVCAALQSAAPGVMLQWRYAGLP